MLEGRAALDFALELTRTPMLATAMQARPLPPDTIVLIRIAAGCEETTLAAAKLAGLPSQTVKEASTLYLQKVLFASSGDCHRVLGVAPGAPRKVMREHMKWLMRWLHPDRDPDEWESIYAARVLQAWREASALKSRPDPEGDLSDRGGRRRRSKRIKLRWVAVPLQTAPARRIRGVRVAVAILFGVLVLAASSVPALAPLSKWFASTAPTTKEAPN